MLPTLPARLRLVADYVAHEDVLERETAGLPFSDRLRLGVSAAGVARAPPDVLYGFCIAPLPGILRLWGYGAYTSTQLTHPKGKVINGRLIYELI